jgi:Icc-related predicted phosphoesterase
MKIWNFSDLHLAFGDLDYKLEIPNADVCVIAGDIADPPLESIRWAWKNIARWIPVVMVAGNHEYYGHEYLAALEQAKAHAHEYPDVHFLENDEVVIDGVRFLGATMWTDFNLYERQKEGIRQAYLHMNDYRTIMYRRYPPERLMPEHTLAIHTESRAWLEGALARPHEGKTVVVTHTCPHFNSIHPKYMGDPVNPAFTSDLSGIITRFQPDVWYHGHSHSNADYVVPETKTRVINNPRGYVTERFEGREIENHEFQPYMVIEI